MARRAEQGFDGFDQGGLVGEGGSGDDEGFGPFIGETFEKVLGNTVGAVEELLEVGGLPEAGERGLRRFGHLGLVSGLLQGLEVC